MEKQSASSQFSTRHDSNSFSEVYDIGIKELQALKDQLAEEEGGSHSANGSPSPGSRMGGVQVV